MTADLEDFAAAVLLDTDDQAMGDGTLSDLVRAVLPDVRKHATEADETATYPRESVAALRASGLMGLLVPREYGGLGGDLADLTTIAQALSGACLSTAMIWAMHCQQVDTLVRHGGDRLLARLLPRIADGSVYLASVTTEPGKGGHLLSATAAVEHTADRLRIGRDAPVVTGGEHAAGFLITMRESADASPERVTLVYADRSQLRLERRGEWDPLGMRGTDSPGMRIDGAVPPDQIVGRMGGFRAVAVDSMIPVGHLAWAACWLGAARAGLSAVIRLARSKRRPRGLDLRSDLVAERLARVRIDLELVSAYLHRCREEVIAYRAAGRSLDTAPAQIHLNALKVSAAELTFRSVDRLIGVAGMAVGYLRSSPLPLERLFRDLRSASLNHSDDRLLIATGNLSILDKAVRLA